jgi:hypothetical protein
VYLKWASSSAELLALVISSLIAASAFRQQFITLNLNEDAVPEAVAMELAGLFRLGSERVE